VEDLFDKLAQFYPHIQHVQLHYKDDEGDNIAIVNQQDLEEAMNIWGKETPLKIMVSKSEAGENKDEEVDDEKKEVIAITRDGAIADMLVLLEDEMVVAHLWEILRFIINRLGRSECRLTLEHLMQEFPFLAEMGIVQKYIEHIDLWEPSAEKWRIHFNFAALAAKMEMMEKLGLDPAQITVVCKQLAQVLKYYDVEQANLEVHEPGVHHGVICDVCGVNPIRTVRYKCTVCENYDMCADCEAKEVHPAEHILNKIRVPKPYVGAPEFHVAGAFPNAAMPVAEPAVEVHHVEPLVMDRRANIDEQVEYFPEQMQVLENLGFHNRDLNRELLRKHSGILAVVIDKLLEL